MTSEDAPRRLNAFWRLKDALKRLKDTLWISKHLKSVLKKSLSLFFANWVYKNFFCRTMIGIRAFRCPDCVFRDKNFRFGASCRTFRRSSDHSHVSGPTSGRNGPYPGSPIPQILDHYRRSAKQGNLTSQDGKTNFNVPRKNPQILLLRKIRKFHFTFCVWLNQSRSGCCFITYFLSTAKCLGPAGAAHSPRSTFSIRPSTMAAPPGPSDGQPKPITCLSFIFNTFTQYWSTMISHTTSVCFIYRSVAQEILIKWKLVKKNRAHTVFLLFVFWDQFFFFFHFLAFSWSYRSVWVRACAHAHSLGPASMDKSAGWTSSRGGGTLWHFQQHVFYHTQYGGGLTNARSSVRARTHACKEPVRGLGRIGGLVSGRTCVRARALNTNLSRYLD